MSNSILDTCAGIFRNLVAATTTTTPATADMDSHEAVNEVKKSGLFVQCSFALVCTATFSEKEAATVCTTTRSGDPD
jgi:hypothetical protein